MRYFIAQVEADGRSTQRRVETIMRFDDGSERQLGIDDEDVVYEYDDVQEAADKVVELFFRGVRCKVLDKFGQFNVSPDAFDAISRAIIAYNEPRTDT